MARQNEYDHRGAGVRDLVRAGLAAAAVILLLVASVGLVWLVGRAPSQSPALAIQGQTAPTPTPRALSFVQKTATAPAPAAAPTATATVAAQGNTEDAVVTAGTPGLPAASTESETPPTDAGDDTTRLEAPGEVEFQTLASGSWTAVEDSLINAGTSAIAEPWLKLTSVTIPPLPSKPKFGSTASSPQSATNRLAWLEEVRMRAPYSARDFSFPAGRTHPASRLTDVAVWEDGYNADPMLAEESFDPGEDWHTYRFEVRGDQLRLVVDGADVVSGAPDPAVDFSPTGAEAGLWAQGVNLEVRKVSVQPLPD